MPTIVEIGQKWSLWVPGRQQWLLASVINQNAGLATLKYDTRYGERVGDDVRVVEESDLLAKSSLFRFVGT